MESRPGGVGILTPGLLRVEDQHGDDGWVGLPDGVFDRELELVNPWRHVGHRNLVYVGRFLKRRETTL